MQKLCDDAWDFSTCDSPILSRKNMSNLIQQENISLQELVGYKYGSNLLIFPSDLAYLNKVYSKKVLSRLLPNIFGEFQMFASYGLIQEPDRVRVLSNNSKFKLGYSDEKIFLAENGVYRFSLDKTIDRLNQGVLGIFNARRVEKTREYTTYEGIPFKRK